MEPSPRTRTSAGSSAEADGERVEKVALRVEVALVERELLGHPERLAGGQDRDLGDRVGVLGEHGDEGVAGLVDGDGVLLLGKQHVGARRAGRG